MPQADNHEYSKGLTSGLTKSNLDLIAQLIAEADQNSTTPEQFLALAEPVQRWFEDYFAGSSELDITKSQVDNPKADTPENNKLYERDKLLAVYIKLWIKFTTPQDDINPNIVVQGLVQEKAKADAERAALEKDPKATSVDRHLSQIKRAAMANAITHHFESQASQLVPSSTPPQIDPALTEYVIDQIKTLSPEKQLQAIGQVTKMYQHAAKASSNQYTNVVEADLEVIEGLGISVPAKVHNSATQFIPASPPLTASEVTTHIDQILAKYPNSPETAQTEIASFLQDPIFKFTPKEAITAAEQYVRYAATASTPVVASQVDTGRAYLENHNVSPDQVAAEVSSSLSHKIPDSPLSDLTASLITNREAAAAITHTTKENSPYFLSALVKGHLPTSLTQILQEANAKALSEFPTPETAQKYLQALGISTETTKILIKPVIDVFTDPDFKAQQSQITALIRSIPKPTQTDISSGLVNNQVTQIFDQSFTKGSPEHKLLTKLQPLITQGLTSAETAGPTIKATARALAFISPEGHTTKTLEQLSPLVRVNPAFKAVTSSTSLLLESLTGRPSTDLTHITNQLTLYHIIYPMGTKDELDYFLSKSIIPKLEALNIPVSEAKAKKMLADFHIHFSQNLIKLSPDQFLTMSITSHLTRAGLSPDQARLLAPKMLQGANLAYYFSGFSEPGRNLAHSKALQARAFAELYKTSLESLMESNPTLKNLRFNNLTFIKVFQDFHTVLGNPKALTPDFLVKIQSPITYSFTQYISGFVPEPLRPILTNAAKALLGTSFMQSQYAQTSGLKNIFTVLAAGPTKFRPLGFVHKFKTGKGALQYNLQFLNKYTGMKVAANPVALAFRKNFQAPVSAATRAAWTKFAATSIGKAVASVGAKVAAKIATNAVLQSALQTLGSAVPIIGNIIALVVGWVVGEILVRLIDPFVKFLKWLKDEAIPAATAFLLGFGSFFAGVGILPSIAIGLGGGTLAAGLKSAITGKTFGASSEAASNAASRINYVMGTIATASVSSTFSAALASIIAIPIVVAFFLYIINSSALVTPPTVYNTGSGVGFQNNSSCPLTSGRITTLSYDDSRQELEASGQRGHGTNGYWRKMTGTDCSFHIPTDGVSCGPTQGSTNYCHINPRCTSGGNNLTDYYGFAIDLVSSDRNVYLPQINGQSANWEYLGMIFPCNSAGCPHQFRTTSSPDGNTYILNFLHLNQNVTSGPYVSGSAFGTLFNQDQFGNTHLHLEVQINDQYVKPENYFCN